MVQKRNAACREEIFLPGTSYDIQLDDYESVRMDFGISLVGSNLAMGVDGGKLTVFRADDNGALTFKRCASNEGLHFFAYRDAVEVWHEYYHLPYGTEPTCLDSDFAVKDAQ